jgi:chitosanase
MARRPFGGGADAVVLDGAGHRVPFAQGTAWTQRTGGSRYTDLTTLDGASLPDGTITADPVGAIAPFYGPDGVDELWIDFGAGRYRLEPTDLADLVEALDGSSSGIPPTTVDAKGDLLVGMAADTVGRLPVGASGKVLSVNPATSTGLAWIDPPANPNSDVELTLTLTSAGAAGVPSGTHVNGDVMRVKALASGADRILNFDAAYRLSGEVITRAWTIPVGQVLVAEAEYVSLINAWVLTRAMLTTGGGAGGGGGGGGTGVLSAGTDTSLAAGNTFTRTATEPAGASITARAWSIVTGPLGEGTTIGTAAALSWLPGSSPTNTTDIRQPVIAEMAYEIVSTAENSTTDWTSAYGYIEDIADDRGYTGGLVGFTSATGDMLQLVQYYQTLKPTGNTLASYISGLQYCTNIGMGSGASAAASSRLGAAFKTAWTNAANTDPVFRRAQRDLRKSQYWDDALTQALADGVGPLGMALHYDVLVNHGPGDDSESYGGIIAAARASSSKPPSQGGTESAYLTKICDLRDAVLVSWDSYQADGRSSIYRALISAAKFSLLTPFTWSVYGDTFTMSTRPTPPSDAVIGTYTLRYTATGAGTDDVVVTVT